MSDRLKSDNNKGISLIEYNYLKLPKKIVKGSTTILYQYDATGKKLRETIGSDITDYSANKIYKNNTLYQISHDEGRIVNGEYEYNITDHLGNLRVAFKDSLGIAKITQANAYGVWGEDLPTLSYQNTSNLNNFKFTGKEFESQTGFNDFGWRRQDPILGRMWSPDPMAEKYFDLSTYNFVANNPVKLIDPDGREIWINYGDGQKVRYENGKLYNEDGSKYNGKDVFVNAVIRNLNKINSTENGKSVLNALSKSENDITFTNTSAKTKDGQMVQGMSFAANENGGGEVHAGFLMSDISKQASQEGKNVESIAHELFHGYQNENGEKGATVNKEVGAYLFGRSISLILGYGIDSFGTFSKEGQFYEKSMSNLLFSNSFNQSDYNSAVRSFKDGSIANNGTGGQIYKNFPIISNQTNPIIRRFFPLLK